MLRTADAARSYVVDTGSEEVRRNKTHLRDLPDLLATQAEEATDNAQEEEEVERMLTDSQACPKWDVKPTEWLKYCSMNRILLWRTILS